MRGMTDEIIVFERVTYGGNSFRTAASQRNIKTDNANIACDFFERDGGSNQRVRAYATIQWLFYHSLYPDGPTMLLADCEWHRSEDPNPLTGNPIVRRDRDHPFNNSCRFTPLNGCNTRPVTLLPLHPDTPEDGTMEVMDKNIIFDEAVEDELV